MSEYTKEEIDTLKFAVNFSIEVLIDMADKDELSDDELIKKNKVHDAYNILFAKELDF